MSTHTKQFLRQIKFYHITISPQFACSRSIFFFKTNCSFNTNLWQILSFPIFGQFNSPLQFQNSPPFLSPSFSSLSHLLPGVWLDRVLKAWTVPWLVLARLAAMQMRNSSRRLAPGGTVMWIAWLGATRACEKTGRTSSLVRRVRKRESRSLTQPTTFFLPRVAFFHEKPTSQT